MQLHGWAGDTHKYGDQSSEGDGGSDGDGGGGGGGATAVKTALSRRCPVRGHPGAQKEKRDPRNPVVSDPCHSERRLPSPAPSPPFLSSDAAMSPNGAMDQLAEKYIRASAGKPESFTEAVEAFVAAVDWSER